MEPLLQELKQEIQDIKHQLTVLWIIFWLATILSIRLGFLFVISDLDIKDSEPLLFAMLFCVQFTTIIYVVINKFVSKKLKRRQLRYLYHTDPKAYREQIELNKEQDVS